jgi:hypothetical protein
MSYFTKNKNGMIHQMMMLISTLNIFGYFLMISGESNISKLGFLLKFFTSSCLLVVFFHQKNYYLVLNAGFFMIVDYIFYRKQKSIDII